MVHALTLLGITAATVSLVTPAEIVKWTSMSVLLVPVKIMVHVVTLLGITAASVFLVTPAETVKWTSMNALHAHV